MRKSDPLAQTTSDPSERRALWIAAWWGFAEATFFFIVPDVWTSRIVLKRTRTGLLACFTSLVGALIGGCLLFQIGAHAAGRETALACLGHLPAINPALIEKAHAGLSSHGWAALFAGVLSGIPYKLYALQVSALGFGIGSFLLISTAARLGRFILVTAMVWLIGATIFRKFSTEAKLRVHAGAWIVFYAVYFWRMGVWKG